MEVKFFFIAGVEGCGHHGLCPVIDTAIRSSIQSAGNASRLFARWPPIREIFNTLWYSEGLTSQQRKSVRNSVAELMQHGVLLAKKTGCTQFILEDNSFPSGMNRDLSRQWDIVEMVELLKPYAEIRFLALYRHPVATTFSHAEWDGGLQNHARLIAAYLEYLNERLLRLDPAIVKVVCYEDIVDRQDVLADPLAQYLGLDVDFIRTGFQQVRGSGKDWKTQMPAESRAWMTRFFDQERQALWPIFNDPSYNIAGYRG